jgi:Zn-dependent peptidase ImmA (M78 family)
VNKARLKRLAIELRSEIDLTPHEPFDPYALAKAYGVDVFGLGDIGCSPEVLNHFHIDRTEVFSGALVPFADGSTVIVENDSHPWERRVSTTSHEMAHVVLEHPFHATLTDSRGCRVSPGECEEEAAELSGELCIPFEAAKDLALRQATNEEAAQEFGVSVDMARWRLDSTGARKFARNARAKWSRKG